MSNTKKLKSQTILYAASMVLAALLIVYLFNYLRPRKVDDQRLVSEKNDALKDKIQIGSDGPTQSQSQEPTILPAMIITLPESKSNNNTKVFMGKTLIVFGNAYPLKEKIIALSGQLGHSHTDDKFHQRLFVKFKNENGQPLIELLKKESAVDYSL